MCSFLTLAGKNAITAYATVVVYQQQAEIQFPFSSHVLYDSERSDNKIHTQREAAASVMPNSMYTDDCIVCKQTDDRCQGMLHHTWQNFFCIIAASPIFRLGEK